MKLTASPRRRAKGFEHRAADLGAGVYRFDTNVLGMCIGSLQTFPDSVTTGITAGLIAARAEGGESGGLLPAVALGSSRVTRLVVGGNPLYGYSHFNEQYSQHMREWFTDERVVGLLLDCERAGINTWQSNYDERVPRQFPRIREAGCKIQWV